MADKATTSTLEGLVRDWIVREWGIWGIVLLAVVVTAALAWWKWEHLKKLPGVGRLIGWFTRWGIPQADPDRYSVLVARLENDPERENEHRIADTINREIEGVQVLRLDRPPISLEGPEPEEMEKRGHERALQYLNRSGASVLVWGTVVSRDGKTAPNLRWTVSAGKARNPNLYHEANPEKPFALPALFWSDLKDTLLLLVASGDAEFRAKSGHYVADQLPQFIARVRTLLAGSSNRSEWDADARGATRVVLADALTTLGEQAGENAPLEQAITVYREALREYARERVPLQWATIQNNLGLALVRLGERESGTEKLEEAVAAFREALKKCTRDRVPLQWAAIKNNLGNALLRLGERESGTKRLEEAVAAFREALKEHTCERVPLLWAGTQNNLGNTLLALGEREGGTGRLEEAVTAFREALKEYSRERVPLDWAMTQNNLGTALRALGERESGTKRLEEAIAAYHEALKERTRERVPLDWAATQNNLGNVFWALGERESGTKGTKCLEEAVAAFEGALEVFEQAEATHYIDVAKANLQRAQSLLAARRRAEAESK